MRKIHMQAKQTRLLVRPPGAGGEDACCLSQARKEWARAAAQTRYTAESSTIGRRSPGALVPPFSSRQTVLSAHELGQRRIAPEVRKVLLDAHLICPSRCPA